LSQFYLHFFKEKSRTIDVEALINFFEKQAGFEVEIDQKSVRFIYTHPSLGYSAIFYLLPKSVVPNIQRVSPQYLDINFHLEVPILSPSYFMKAMIQIVKHLCDDFKLFVLSEMFNDALEFNENSIFKVFLMVKKAWIEKYPDQKEKYYFIREDKMNAILRYTDELEALQEYYEDLNTVVPKYYFIKDEQQNPYTAIEWEELTITVFPPYLDYILFHQKDGILKVIDYKEFLAKHERILLDVPGFLPGTKVMTKKTLKKLSKSARKDKFNPVSKQFSKYHLHQLMD